jgi:hypothetical protein
MSDRLRKARGVWLISSGVIAAIPILTVVVVGNRVAAAPTATTIFFNSNEPINDFKAEYH